MAAGGSPASKGSILPVSRVAEKTYFMDYGPYRYLVHVQKPKTDGMRTEGYFVRIILKPSILGQFGR